MKSLLIRCGNADVRSIAAVQPLHVVTWLARKTPGHAAPTAKLGLAVTRHLFDWHVTGQVIPVNPAASVRGLSHLVRQSRTLVLEPIEVQVLLHATDITTQAGLRDRVQIVLLIYSFARIGTALAMRVEDVVKQNRRLRVRLREKGEGARHASPP